MGGAMKRVLVLLVVVGVLGLAGCANGGQGGTTLTSASAATTASIAAADTTVLPTTTTTEAPTTTTAAPTTTTTLPDFTPALKVRADAWFTFLDSIKDSKNSTVKKAEAFLEPGSNAHERAVTYVKGRLSDNRTNPESGRKIIMATTTDDGTAGSILISYNTKYWSQSASAVVATHWRSIEDEWYRANGFPDAEIVRASGPVSLATPVQIGDALWAFNFGASIKILKGGSYLPNRTTKGQFVCAVFTVKNLGTGSPGAWRLRALTHRLTESDLCTDRGGESILRSQHGGHRFPAEPRY